MREIIDEKAHRICYTCILETCVTEKKRIFRDKLLRSGVDGIFRPRKTIDVTTSYNSVDRAAWLGKVTSQRHACRTGNKMAA
jgi:hypothetical protein